MSSIRRICVLGLLALAGAACSDSTSPGEDPVSFTVVSWGGAYQEAMTDAWFEPYMAANPHVTLIQDGPTSYQAIEDQVSGGTVTWDLVDVENAFGLAADEHLLEPIDCDEVPCADLQPERFRTTGYRVPVMQWALVLAYRSDAWGGAEPAGWEDFFDLDQFPGARAVRSSAAGGGILEAALLADGVEPASLYPLDLDRAIAKLDDLAGAIVWWDDGQRCPEHLADDTAPMGLCYNGRVYDVQQDGHPLEIQWTQALVQADYLVIPKGSTHVEAAMDLIAYMTSAEHNADLSHFISYAPVHRLALDDVDPAIAPDLPSTYSDVTVARDDLWLEENRDDMQSRLDAWRAANGG